jgi:hypothetical protein
MIFTDGNKQSTYYETCRVDESSTPFATVFTSIKVNPGTDQITIPKKDGSPAAVVNESNRTNILSGRSLSATGQEVYANCINTGVIHEIKKALIFGEVDTRP